MTDGSCWSELPAGSEVTVGVAVVEALVLALPGSSKSGASRIKAQSGRGQRRPSEEPRFGPEGEVIRKSRSAIILESLCKYSRSSCFLFGQVFSQVC